MTIAFLGLSSLSYASNATPYPDDSRILSEVVSQREQIHHHIDVCRTAFSNVLTQHGISTFDYQNLDPAVVKLKDDFKPADKQTEAALIDVLRAYSAISGTIVSSDEVARSSEDIHHKWHEIKTLALDNLTIYHLYEDRNNAIFYLEDDEKNKFLTMGIIKNLLDLNTDQDRTTINDITVEIKDNRFMYTLSQLKDVYDTSRSNFYSKEKNARSILENFDALMRKAQNAAWYLMTGNRDWQFSTPEDIYRLYMQTRSFLMQDLIKTEADAFSYPEKKKP